MDYLYQIKLWQIFSELEEEDDDLDCDETEEEEEN